MASVTRPPQRSAADTIAALRAEVARSFVLVHVSVYLSVSAKFCPTDSRWQRSDADTIAALRVQVGGLFVAVVTVVVFCLLLFHPLTPLASCRFVAGCNRFSDCVLRHFQSSVWCWHKRNGRSTCCRAQLKFLMTAI